MKTHRLRLIRTLFSALFILVLSTVGCQGIFGDLDDMSEPNADEIVAGDPCDVEGAELDELVCQDGSWTEQCEEETVAEICQRTGAECGEVSVTDAICGTDRTVQCDELEEFQCSSVEVCETEGGENRCECMDFEQIGDGAKCDHANAVGLCGEVAASSICEDWSATDSITCEDCTNSGNGDVCDPNEPTPCEGPEGCAALNEQEITDPNGVDLIFECIDSTCQASPVPHDGIQYLCNGGIPCTEDGTFLTAEEHCTVVEPNPSVCDESEISPEEICYNYCYQKSGRCLEEGCELEGSNLVDDVVQRCMEGTDVLQGCLDEWEQMQGEMGDDEICAHFDADTEIYEGQSCNGSEQRNNQCNDLPAYSDLNPALREEAHEIYNQCGCTAPSTGLPCIASTGTCGGYENAYCYEASGSGLGGICTASCSENAETPEAGFISDITCAASDGVCVFPDALGDDAQLLDIPSSPFCQQTCTGHSDCDFGNGQFSLCVPSLKSPDDDGTYLGVCDDGTMWTSLPYNLSADDKCDETGGCPIDGYHCSGGYCLPDSCTTEEDCFAGACSPGNGCYLDYIDL